MQNLSIILTSRLCGSIRSIQPLVAAAAFANCVIVQGTFIKSDGTDGLWLFLLQLLIGGAAALFCRPLTWPAVLPATLAALAASAMVWLGYRGRFEHSDSDLIGTCRPSKPRTTGPLQVVGRWGE